MKFESGVMVLKNGKAWGVVCKDGNSILYGWIDPEEAPIYNPKFCKKPTDITWKDSPYIEEIKTGKLVRVERVTTVKILGD